MRLSYLCARRVTVSISTVMNESASVTLESAAKMAAYVTSLIVHDRENFAKKNFTIKSIAIRTSHQ